MFKAIAVHVKDPTRNTNTPPHFDIEADAVVRQKRPITPAATLVIDIVGNSEYNISDAQCQSVVSLVLASQVNYQVDSSKVKCYGIEWDELVRRG